MNKREKELESFLGKFGSNPKSIKVGLGFISSCIKFHPDKIFKTDKDKFKDLYLTCLSIHTDPGLNKTAQKFLESKRHEIAFMELSEKSREK